MAEPFELNLDPDRHDILSSAGFANAVVQVLRLKAGSGCLHAPVCSSWVWMSTSEKFRKHLNILVFDLYPVPKLVFNMPCFFLEPPEWKLHRNQLVTLFKK